MKLVSSSGRTDFFAGLLRGGCAFFGILSEQEKVVASSNIHGQMYVLRKGSDGQRCLLCSWAVKGARASKRAQSPKLHHQLSVHLFEAEVAVDCAVAISNAAARHLDVARNPKFRWLQGCLGTLGPLVVSLIVIAHRRDMSLRQITKQSIAGRLF